MTKLTNIKKRFKNDCWFSEDKKYLIIKCCAIGDNFFNYDEPKRKNFDYSNAPELKNDSRIIICPCDECCGCGDW